MGMDVSDFLAMQRRVAPKTAPQTVSDEGVDRESKLHDEIVKWCDSQWPRWKYYHARMDKKSTLDLGVADICAFGPFPLCVIVECKKINRKLDPDQRDWIKEMEMLGWLVPVVRSMDQFLSAVEAARSALK